jgi:hypothetical protein
VDSSSARSGPVWAKGTREDYAATEPRPIVVSRTTAVSTTIAR